MKWILLLLSQELDLPSLFRLWDTLFVYENPYEFLYYIGLALVMRSKQEILTGDFAIILETLQH